MHLVPTRDEVLALLRGTGGLREGHFEYPSGLHASEYLQVALTMRYYQAAEKRLLVTRRNGVPGSVARAVTLALYKQPEPRPLMGDVLNLLWTGAHGPAPRRKR